MELKQPISETKVNVSKTLFFLKSYDRKCKKIENDLKDIKCIFFKLTMIFTN